MTVVELAAIGVKQWHEIAQDFEGADLLLGNGFSLLFAEAFHYGSLFKEFLKGIPDELAVLYQSLGTTNFERLQRILKYAQHVNSVLRHDTVEISGAILALQNGLLKTISSRHPGIDGSSALLLGSISREMGAFGDIFTTNYDLFLYHLVMRVRDLYDGNAMAHRYNDYFWKEFSQEYLEFVDYQNYTDYRHVYYLHGALFLFPGWGRGSTSDLKIRRGSEELIVRVKQEIDSGHVPLFVSEGASKDKLYAIRQSPYLSFALKKLGESSEQLIVFGHSLSEEQDEHIIHTLRRRKRTIAVSVYVREKTRNDVYSEALAIRSRLKEHDVVVFDSSGLFRACSSNT